MESQTLVPRPLLWPFGHWRMLIISFWWKPLQFVVLLLSEPQQPLRCSRGEGLLALVFVLIFSEVDSVTAEQRDNLEQVHLARRDCGLVAPRRISGCLSGQMLLSTGSSRLRTWVSPAGVIPVLSSCPFAERGCFWPSVIHIDVCRSPGLNCFENIKHGLSSSVRQKSWGTVQFTLHEFQVWALSLERVSSLPARAGPVLPVVVFSGSGGI